MSCAVAFTTVLYLACSPSVGGLLFVLRARLRQRFSVWRRCAAVLTILYGIFSGNTEEALRYRVDELWLERNRVQLKTGGCGRCRLSLEDATNTVVTHCASASPDGRCLKDELGPGRSE